MDGPTFVLHPPRSALPYRDRRLFFGCSQWFTPRGRLAGDNGGGFALLVLDGVRDEVRRLAHRAHPDEWFGLLLGRSFHDHDGDYTVVIAAVSPPAFTSTPGHFHVDHHQSAAVTAAALEQHPMLDMVGWWHSHSVPSGFSPVDRAEQRAWQSPHQVGLLVFTSGDPWAVAYQGPDARLLELAPTESGEVGWAAATAFAGTSASRGTQRADGHRLEAPTPAPSSWGHTAAATEATPPPRSASRSGTGDTSPPRSARVGWWWWATIAACVTVSLALASLAVISP